LEKERAFARSFFVKQVTGNGEDRDMSAQGLRLAISLCAMAVALFAFMELPGWAGVIAAGISVALGAGAAEVVFRRLADAETQRADLEDRVRNPPIG
jgi:hypothetical protein